MKRTVGYAAIALFCVGFLLCLIYPTKDYSVSERRELAQFPEVSTKTVLSGTFMSDFEEYAADQFPFREIFRSIKAGFSRYVLQQKDDNGIYVSEGHISKMDGEMNEASLDRAADRFTYVYEKYMKEKGIVPYLSLVPDKNYFLAENSGHPAYDYEAFSSYIIGKVPYMEYIDLFSVLTKEDYYYTDPHWKQENLVEAAKKIAETMGTSLPEQYAKETME